MPSKPHGFRGFFIGRGHGPSTPSYKCKAGGAQEGNELVLEGARDTNWVLKP